MFFAVKFWKEFKEFAFKGNVISLAVGVVIGNAFGKITTSLVNDIIMPVFSAVLGGINPSGGSGKAVGILISIITLQFLSSGFNLLHVSTFLKDLTWGALLIFVMALNTLEPRRKGRGAAKTAEEKKS